MKQIKNMLKESQEAGEFDDTITEADLLFNQRVKQVYQREGPFQIPDLPREEIEKEEIVDKGPFRLGTGVIYIG